MNYKLINPDYLDSISGGDPQFIAEIVTMFRDQVNEFFEEMKLLYSRKDYPALGMMAHKAKSSVAIMGMSELANMLKTLELSAKEGKDTELYESYINKFGEDTKNAVTELNDLVNNRLKKS
jgi:HPt (histidine-containing phosphotransfer) domain-containing protein